MQAILPGSIAEKLKEGPAYIAERYDGATVLFADLVGFTPLAASMEPERVVAMLNELFRRLWGDTVNVAARMESHGKPGEVQVSESAFRELAPDFELEERGMVEVKGRGPMPTWFLRTRRAGTGSAVSAE
ncbi:MAG: hypothetical protein JST92_19700 [Deltaproteobacteria bacterium]|nr:hypothetical protein [Deltaproteobacteria bacterium]